MRTFKVLLCICSVTIASIFGQPSNNLNNVRNVRQTSQKMLRQGLQNFPASQLYQTHVIDYPGGIVTNSNSNPNPSHPTSHAIPNVNYQQQTHFSPVNVQYNTVPQPQQIITTPTTTTTTTESPIIVGEFEQEVQETIPAVPIIRTPITTTTNNHRFGLRRQQYTGGAHVRNQAPVQQRFSGQDIVDNEPLQNEAIAAPVVRPETEEERLLREEQAKSAHYSFGTSIDDGINDHSIHRQETREGLALRGMYSYSDGYYARTIHYVADENGYRVVKEEIEPIGDGPQFNPNGTADVTSNLHNNHLSYSITAQDFVREKQNKTVSATKRHL